MTVQPLVTLFLFTWNSRRRGDVWLGSLKLRTAPVVGEQSGSCGTVRVGDSKTLGLRGHPHLER